MLATKKTITVPNANVLAQRQHEEDERSQKFGASSVRYSVANDRITLVMRSGIEYRIPRGLVRELVDIPATLLGKELSIGIGGDSLHVRSHDVDIAIRGLLRDLTGDNIQQRGGLAKTKAKAAAARSNGKKGGRPKKSAVRLPA